MQKKISKKPVKKTAKKVTKKPVKKPEPLTLKDISTEMQKRIASMMYNTWYTIGDDLLRCLEECGEPAVLKRNDVIDMVCDADYMLTYGNDREAYQVSEELDYKDLVKIGKKAFPYSRYGW